MHKYLFIYLLFTILHAYTDACDQPEAELRVLFMFGTLFTPLIDMLAINLELTIKNKVHFKSRF